MSQKSLLELIQAWQTAVAGTGHPAPPPFHGRDVTITHLVEHTDEVTPGCAFVARVRQNSDGHPFIPRAIELGASLILAERSAKSLEVVLPEGITYWQVPDTAYTQAWLAAAWHDFPGRQLVTIGVTGTDGKTTTCNLLYEILQTAGLRVGLISTIKAVLGDIEEPTGLHVTTPEAPAVQEYLRRMVDAGLTHCILETTSIGLAQHRVTAVGFAAGLVTNITHEHINDHGSDEAYVAAKARLFEMVAAHHQEGGLGWGILNKDDRSYERLSRIPGLKALTYSLEKPADFTARAIEFDPDQTRFELVLPDDAVMPIESHLVGQFNIYNLLCAAAGAFCLGIDPEAIREGLQAVSAVSGRMERIHEGQPFLTIVDFAHTPNALEKAVEAARSMIADVNGRVIVVFGSAGKRDVEKRRMMAEIAAARADLSVLTAEDPRTESLDGILEMMAAGATSKGGREFSTFWRIPDRGQAIYFALTLARPQDLVLICGKGHEQSMCFGTIEYTWDDREATRRALQALLRGEPMPDLGLPSFDPTFDPGS